MVSAFRVVELVALGLELAGVLAILAGFVVATARYLMTPGRLASHAAYIHFRHDMGRSILLGLDFLIAGDIIKTVIVTNSGQSVLVLGAIVLIRTFLSMTLYLELEGRWPWQSPRRNRSDDL